MNIEEYAQEILERHHLISEVCVQTHMSLEFLRELGLTMAWVADAENF